MKPKISIIICTYNGEGLVEKCLDSILAQNYKNFEILCLDGGSSDNTKAIIKNYSKIDKRIKLLINKNRFPEGKGNGKWIGYKNSKGEVIGFIDQDNVLQNKDLFHEAEKILNKEGDVIGVLGGVKHDMEDDRVLRYIALFGTDSFFAYRSLDFIRNVKNLRTEVRGVPRVLEHTQDLCLLSHELKKGVYASNKSWCIKNANSGKIEISPICYDNMILTGGNCFFYRKKDLDKVGGYSQDVLVLKKLVKNREKEIVILKDSTKHYAEKNLYSLAKKKFFWGKTFFSGKGKEKFDYLPKTKRERWTFLKNLFFNLLLIPNLFYSYKVYKKSRDSVSFLFPLNASLNTVFYGINFIRGRFNF